MSNTEKKYGRWGLAFALLIALALPSLAFSGEVGTTAPTSVHSFTDAAAGTAQDHVPQCPFRFLSPKRGANPRPGLVLRVPLHRTVAQVVGHLIGKLTGHDPFQGNPAPPKIPLSRFGGLVMRGFTTPVEILSQVHEVGGATARVEMPTGRQWIFTTDQDITTYVLKNTDINDHSPFEKSDLTNGGFQFLVGMKNIFTGKGKYWKMDRQTLQKHFTPSALTKPESYQHFSDVLDASVGRLEARAADDPEKKLHVNTLREMSCVTLDFALQTLFQYHLPESELRGSIQPAFAEVLENLAPEALSPFKKSLSEVLPMKYGRLKKSYAILDKLAARILAEKRAHPGGNGIIEDLMKRNDPDTGKPRTDKVLKDEILTLLLAGHETTSTLLTWALLSASKEPRIAEELRRESANKPGGPEPRDQTPFLDAVMQEALRLYSPSYSIARDVKEDVTVPTAKGPVFFPKGSRIIMTTYLMHRNPEVWGAKYPPEAFVPERWLAGSDAGKPGRIMPFSFGPRVCIGNQLSMLEFKLLLTKILNKFDVTPDAPGDPAQIVGHLKPKDGFPATLTLRRRTPHP